MKKLIELFYKNVDMFPNKLAVICNEQSYSYKEFEELVNTQINFLHEKNIKYKDNVGVLLPNDCNFIALIFAASALGISLTPLCPTQPEWAINTAFNAVDVKHVIGSKAVLSDLNLQLNGEIIDIDTINSNNTKRFIAPELTGNEPLIFTMTSGSTGQPKPIVLSQRNKIDRAFAAIELYSVTSDDIILAATPLYHSLAERLVIMPLLIGATSVLMPRFAPSLWLNTIKNHSVTFTIAVSSQLRQIAEVLTSPFLPEINSLRCIVSSSALLEPHTKKELVTKLNCDFHECYGTSEIAIATNLNIFDSKEKMNSVGKAIPNVDVKILRSNNTFANTDEIGEIVCKTPMLFMGYYKQEEKTKESMFGEYFKTGDLGKIDKDGFLYFIDRQKDLIISGGINVYPNDIEQIAMQFEGIKECAAFPFPEENLGEIVAIAIVADKDFNLRKFKFHCAKKLADFQLPRKYFIVDSLPKNNMGKLTKHKLTEMFVEQEYSNVQ